MNRQKNLTKYALIATAVIVMTSSSPIMGFNYADDFSELNTKVWDKCQMPDNEIEIVEEGEETFIRIKVDRDSVNSATEPENRKPCGTKQSRAKARQTNKTERITTTEDHDDRLGPNLLSSSGTETPECSATKIKKIQRNELRFHKKIGRQDSNHFTTDEHWYRFQFRRRGEHEKNCSTRWSLFQWKAPDDMARIKDRSPHLAVRTDNGVLYVAIQSDACRCRIAKGEGDPDQVNVTVTESNESSSSWAPPTALKLLPGSNYICRATTDSSAVSVDPQNDRFLENGESCKPDLKVYVPQGRQDTMPELASRWCEEGDQNCQWTDLTVHFRKTDNGKADQIDLYEGGQFVVRATGLVGYEQCSSSNYRTCCTGINKSTCKKPYKVDGAHSCRYNEKGLPDLGSLMCADENGEPVPAAKNPTTEELPVKFKFGHYRDWMDRESYLEVNNLCIGTTAEKINKKSCW